MFEGAVADALIERCICQHERTHSRGSARPRDHLRSHPPRLAQPELRDRRSVGELVGDGVLLLLRFHDRGAGLPEPMPAVPSTPEAADEPHRRPYDGGGHARQLLADFEDGLAVGRLEHALGRLRRGETERVIDASSDSERPAEDSSP